MNWTRNQFFCSSGGKEKLISEMLSCKVTGLGKSPSMKDRRLNDLIMTYQWRAEGTERGKKLQI